MENRRESLTELLIPADTSDKSQDDHRQAATAHVTVMFRNHEKELMTILEEERKKGVRMLRRHCLDDEQRHTEEDGRTPDRNPRPEGGLPQARHGRAEPGLEETDPRCPIRP